MKSLIAILTAALLACSAPAFAAPHGGGHAGGGHPGGHAGGVHTNVHVGGGHGGGFGHGGHGFDRGGRSGGYWCHGIWTLELPVIGCL